MHREPAAMGPMGATTETGFGWATPVLSYVMACVGAALGLRCTVRALDSTGRVKRNWLLAGAVSIGAGIWTMHFIAMLGFAVTGTEIRYGVSLTLLSLVRSEEHTSELQSQSNLVCRLLLE